MEKIFDRNGDADINITGRHSQIADMYRRKDTNYSEDKIFPFATLSDMRLDLLEKARLRAKLENSGTHPWVDMTDMELLKSAGLYKTDISTGQEGITLAGILLFGKDETILSALPHHKTDATTNGEDNKVKSRKNTHEKEIVHVHEKSN